ncbi:MAG: PhnD/SsuA/transferrin family substrate-binding protein [Oscillospiraceae bacterium]|nr:PhnD/SsuA/transferrin family substrate-binding protein [Oscillospiraceae bacterium]
MRKTRTIALLLVFALLLGIFAACKDTLPGDRVTPDEKVRLAVLKGPTGLGSLQLMEDTERYDVTICAAPAEVTGMLTAGTIDVAALPLNVAATLYNKGGGDIVLLNVYALGVLYIVERGDTINSIADLKGKTIHAPAKGSTTEMVLNFLLAANDLDPEEDLTIEWVADPAALNALVLTGDADIALLPEPNVTVVTSRDEDLRIAVDLNVAWEEASGGNRLAMGGLVARREFLNTNSEIVDAVIEDFTSSVHFANGNRAQAGVLAERHGIIADAALAENSILRSNLVSIVGEDMKKLTQDFLTVLFEADPVFVGGKMPGKDFYYGG